MTKLLDYFQAFSSLPRRQRKMLLVIVVVAIVWVWRALLPGPESAPYTGETQTPGARAGSNAEAISDAFIQRRSGVWVEGSGRVQRILVDDLKGSRHQRFVLDLTGGQTVLVAHNIDLADRVPLSLGDHVDLRGEYEWNSQGGIVHWTHHDPQGRRRGGWIQYQGRTYR